MTTLRSLVRLALVALALPALAAEETLLLRTPTVSRTRIVFAHAGDLWSVDRAGGDAVRLTSGATVQSDPFFSPDGRMVAFSSREGGNADVYVVDAAGGIPRRLTWHPGDDVVRGWTPDGKNVLFASGRTANSERYEQLFLVPATGGWPSALPLPMASRGAFAPDGIHLAYTPLADAFWTWKRYRGGQTTPIWIVDLKTLALEEVPHQNASDTAPVYLDGTLYFLSDRDGAMNVYAYDAAAKSVRALTHHADADVRALSAGGGALVYEQGGRLHELDPKSGASRALAIRIAADYPATHPHLEHAAEQLANARLSPSGVRVLFEAHGDIVSVPAEKGTPRNLTHTPGAHERYPAWSPDGREVAFLTDRSGEYELAIVDQNGLAPPRVYTLGTPGFYYDPVWSPDGKHIAFTSRKLELALLDLGARAAVTIDTDTYDEPDRSLDPDWSPDGRYLAYTKRLANHLRAVFVYDVTTKQKHQVTDGTRDVISARFSPDGHYLYFASSSNVALSMGWLEMSSFERPVRRTLEVALLAMDEASPLAPESDEEPPRAAHPGARHAALAEKPRRKHGAKPAPKAAPEEPAAGSTGVRIDFDGLARRIVPLPVPEGDYRALRAAPDGALFYLESQDGVSGSLHRFDLATRKDHVFGEDVLDYDLARDGAKLLYHSETDDGETWTIVDAAAPPEGEPAPLDVEQVEVPVDPPAEWREEFDEAARILRDFFYDPGLHGLDWPRTVARYRALLPYVGHRTDLTYLLSELGGELVAGHVFVEEPDEPGPLTAAVGLLGADFVLDHGLYRFAKIYRDPATDADTPAPLGGPGSTVREGDYLLAVNGQALTAADDLFRSFEGTANRQTFLLVNSKPGVDGARTLRVVPALNDAALRHRAWVLRNRERVLSMSKGRVAYVYLPDTDSGGYDAFNRDYFSQVDKHAVVLDDRFNSGGAVADYIIDLLGRTPLSWWVTREGEMFPTPLGAIFGPRVLIANEYSSSGGDALAQFFRRRGLGPIVGRRTWGGLIGIYEYPALMDGGTITAPRVAIVSPEGAWEVENVGVAPDVDVPLTPLSVAGDHDPQLERAVSLVLEALDKQPPVKPKRPPYPVKAH